MSAVLIQASQPSVTFPTSYRCQRAHQGEISDESTAGLEAESIPQGRQHPKFNQPKLGLFTAPPPPAFDCPC